MLKIDLLDPTSYGYPNWANDLDADSLADLGRTVVEDVEYDQKSREGWLDEAELWMDMASQILDTGMTPWEGAAAVKYPMLSIASLQFHARAQEELLRGDRLVRGRVVGEDRDGKKAERSWYVSRAMSNQLLYQMEDWQEDTDRLLFVLPLVGTVFRKVYWSQLLRRPASELILPTDLIVNYFATDWERARKTHWLLKSRNEIIEQMRQGEYREFDLPDQAELPKIQEREDGDSDAAPGQERIYPEKDIPFTVYEQHWWWDLDGDGYAEPYIVTVLEQTKEVLKVCPRFDADQIHLDANDKIAKITAYEYIIVHKFLPDIESSIYGSGFGKMLGPTSAAVDTLINQLLDAGHYSTRPAGLYGKNVRMARGGSFDLAPGEWQATSARMEDLQKGFWKYPTEAPSPVLFQLLGLLIQAGERLGQVTETMQGKMPGQNTPHNTTSDVMEQGQKVFLSIYKRLYRSLTQEFRALQRLNYLYLEPQGYQDLMDFQQEAPQQPQQPGPDGQEPPEQPPQYVPQRRDPQEDFSPVGLDIIPEADPDLANSMRKRRRTQQLIEARNAGMPINDKYLVRLFLEGIDEPEVEKVMQTAPPPPSEAELNHKAKMAEIDVKRQEMMITAGAREFDSTLALGKALEAIAKAESLGQGQEMEEMKASLQMMLAQNKERMAETDLIRKQIMGQIELQHQQDRNSLDLHAQATRNALEAEAGKQKLEVEREKVNTQQRRTETVGKQSAGTD